MWELKVREFKKCIDYLSKIEVEGLRMYWLGLNVEIKRKFMEVSIVDFISYVWRFYGIEGRKVLEKVVGFVVSKKKWRFWMCRFCLEEFFIFKKFKIYFEKEYVIKFKFFMVEYMV